MSSEIAETPQESISLPEPCIAEERSLLNEAREEHFKTIEEAEAFLRRENHTLVKPMDERAITSRVDILRNYKNIISSILLPILPLMII